MSSGSAELPGTSRFDVRRRLGAGGMGVVYEAFDRERATVVALKTLFSTDAASIYRLKREFRSLADVSHPNLVVLHELVSEGGRWFFTMDLIEGVDFLSWVGGGVDPKSAATVEMTPSGAEDILESGTRPSDAGRPVEEARLRAALVQLVRGVQALHQAGKLHRDLKPSNVLVSPEGHVTVLDFGLVADDQPSTDLYRSIDDKVLGTPAYMAPEQAAGRPATAASDWYAMGAMLYEALTGVLPFAGSLVHVLAMKQLRDPAPPSEIAPDAPADLAALCMDLLRRDPDLRPTGSEVMARLTGGSAAPRRSLSPSSRDVPLLVGRASQLAALHDALGVTRSGTPTVLRLHGPSGYGKSAVAHSFLDELRGRDAAVVLAGRCYERESVPFKALDTVIDSLSRYLRRLPAAEAAALMPRDVHTLARIFPVLWRVEAVAEAPTPMQQAADAQELRRRAFQALQEMLARIADRRPLVIFVDDLQWGDADSAALLAEVLRPPDAPALLFVGSWRSEDAAGSPLVQYLQRLSPPTVARDITLDRLSPEEALEVTRELLAQHGVARQDLAAAIAREAEGSPFFVGELVRHAVEQRDAGDAQASPSLKDVLRRRIARLPEDARRLLEVVSVASGPVETTVAVRAAELDRGAPSALVALRSGSLVRSHALRGEELLETYHDRIREGVTAELGQERLRSVHARLAAALVAGEGEPDPETIAVHLEGAGAREEAGRYAVEAAHRAAGTLAFDRAARLYRRALSLGPEETPDRWRTEAALADALAHDGRSAEAAEAYLRAAGHAPAETVELRRLAAEHFLRSGHVDRGVEVMESVLAGVGMKLPSTPRRALLSLLAHRARQRLLGLSFEERREEDVPVDDLRRIDAAWTAAMGLSMIDLIRGAEFQARHLRYALRAGEPYRVARALAIEAAHVASTGRRGAERAVELLDRAEELGRRIDHPHAIGLVEAVRGACGFLAGRWKQTFEHTEAAEEVLRERCTNVSWERSTNMRFNLVALYYTGRLRELARRVPERAETARERDDLYARFCAGAGCAVGAWLARDDVDTAQRSLEELSRRWSERGFQLQHYMLLQGYTHLDLYVGRGERAWERVSSQWPAIERSLMLRVQMLRVIIRAERAACALAAGGEERLRIAESDAKRLASEQIGWGAALATAVRAGVRRGRGDVEGAIQLLGQAAEELDALDAALFAAAARRHRGTLLGGEAGRVEVEAEDARFRAEGVRDPEAASHMLCAGFR